MARRDCILNVEKRTTITYHGRKGWKLLAEASIVDLAPGKQAPYFAIGGEISWAGNGPSCCGCIHDDIGKAFPSWRKYMKWHLFSVGYGPMSYIANALFWAGWLGWCNGRIDSPPNFEHLKKTVCWGVLPGETDDVLRKFMNTHPRPGDISKARLSGREAGKLRKLLENRLPDLVAAFNADMCELFGAEYAQTFMGRVE